MSKTTDDLTFEILLPRRPRDAAWVINILRQLWEHGLSFPDFPNESLTWEGQLAADGRLAPDLPALLAKNLTVESLGVSVSDGQFVGSLRTCIESMILGGGGSIPCNNDVGWCYLSFDFTVNPYLDWVQFSIATTEAEVIRDRDPDYPRDSYMDVYRSFVDWSQLLCEIVDPLFAFGYRSADLSNNEALLDLHYSGGQELLANQLIPVESWFYTPPLRYLAPAFLDVHAATELQTPPHQRVVRLDTGGLFLIPRNPAYTAEAYGAHLYLMRAKEKLEELISMQSGDKPVADRATVEQLHRQGKAEANRARGVFETVGEREGVRECEWIATRLDGYAEGVVEKGWEKS